MVPPIFTIVPGALMNRVSRPADGASISTTALSVSISATTSPPRHAVAVLAGPAHQLAFADGEVAERHVDRLALDRRRASASVPAVRLAARGAGARSPPAFRRRGRASARVRGRGPAITCLAVATMRSVSTSIARSSAGAERVGDGVRVQPRDRRVELVEGQLVHRLAELGADAAHRPALVDHQQPMRPPHARGDRVDVERQDGAQVDHLALDALARPGSRPPPARDARSWPADDDGEVGARPRDAGDAERDEDARRPAPRPWWRTAPWAPA